MADTPEYHYPHSVASNEGFSPAAPPPLEPAPLPSFGVNASAELVADLIAATGLLAPDRVAQVRSRATQTRSSFAQALVDEGLASGPGVARMLACGTTCRSSSSA